MTWENEDTDFGIEEVPQRIAKKLVRQKVRRITCPSCDDTFFGIMHSGYNNHVDCPHCGEEYTIVG